MEQNSNEKILQLWNARWVSISMQDSLIQNDSTDIAATLDSCDTSTIFRYYDRKDIFSQVFLLLTKKCNVLHFYNLSRQIEIIRGHIIVISSHYNIGCQNISYYKDLVHIWLDRVLSTKKTVSKQLDGTDLLFRYGL